MEFFLVTGGVLLVASSGWILAGIHRMVRTRTAARLEGERIRERGLLERLRLELESRRLDDDVYLDFTRRQASRLPPGVPPASPPGPTP